MHAREMYVLPRGAATFKDLWVKAACLGMDLQRSSGIINGERYRYVLRRAGQRAYLPTRRAIEFFLSGSLPRQFENAPRTSDAIIAQA